jgi:glycerol-3-phosphate dehydrogenase
MRNKLYDVIIIGGGINGAGIARDAAERGLSVFLAEKNDFGFGTTFRSTKLIHGGLRYLEYYEMSLVRESLRERETLLKTAPHLVKPIRFVLPVYDDNKYGYGKVKLGLLTYDVLSYDKTLENHRSFSGKGLLAIEPNIRSRSLKGGFTYCDCQISYPERLCLENILMAKEAGADVCSYTNVTDLLKKNSRIEGVRIQDGRTGDNAEVRGRCIVNAAGPWVDEILKLEGPALQPRLSGTKGSHILLSRFQGGPKNALYVPAYQDGRPFFIIPWRDYYWVGTTDIRYNGSLDEVCPTKQEVDYLIREVNFIAPAAKLTTSDVIYSLAGIRPLPATRNGTEEAEITRRHIIFDHEDEGVDGLISIIGGKLTTYRNLAEEAVDYLFKKLERPAPPCQTSTRPLLGGGMKDINRYVRDNSTKYSSRYGLDGEQVRYLISIYGRKFWRVLSLLDMDPKLGERICRHNPDIKAQLVFSIQNELPKSLSDIYLRRTGVGTSACQGLDCAETGARIMGKNLKWRRKQIKREVADYEKSVEVLFG